MHDTRKSNMNAETTLCSPSSLQESLTIRMKHFKFSRRWVIFLCLFKPLEWRTNRLKTLMILLFFLKSVRMLSQTVRGLTLRSLIFKTLMDECKSLSRKSCVRFLCMFRNTWRSTTSLRMTLITMSLRISELPNTRFNRPLSKSDMRTITKNNLTGEDLS